jgi:hypothetical protein
LSDSGGLSMADLSQLTHGSVGPCSAVVKDDFWLPDETDGDIRLKLQEKKTLRAAAQKSIVAKCNKQRAIDSRGTTNFPERDAYCVCPFP